MVCPNCGNDMREGATFCAQCGVAVNNTVLTENNPLSDEEKLAIEFYTGQRKYTYSFDLPKIEPYFFKASHFVPDFEIACGDFLNRRFILNKEKTLYYCSPTHENGKFKIRECNKIQSIEFMENIAGDNALKGAFLYGAAGAVIGSTKKKEVIWIRLNTSDTDEPIVNLEILSSPLSRKDETYKKCYEAANKIYGQLKAIAEKNNPANDKNKADDDFIAKLKELSDLKQHGFLTDEEFVLAKQKLLK